MEIGEKIKTIRKNKCMSQSEFEKKTGMKREYLSKIENSELKNPTYNTLKKIVGGLGVSLSYLEEYSGNGDVGKTFREDQDKIKKEIKFLEEEITKKETVLKDYIKTLGGFKQRRLLLFSQLTEQ